MTAEQISERRAKWFWVTIIVGLLGSQLGVGVVAIVIANSDPSTTAFPNYHQRALDWDKTAAIRQQSEQLGWTIDVHVAGQPDSRNFRAITLTLTDATSQPIMGAKGSLKLFHHKLASDVLEYPLDELSHGVYRVDSRMIRPGLWQMEVRISAADGAEYVHERTFELLPSGAEDVVQGEEPQS